MVPAGQDHGALCGIIPGSIKTGPDLPAANKRENMSRLNTGEQEKPKRTTLGDTQDTAAEAERAELEPAKPEKVKPGWVEPGKSKHVPRKSVWTDRLPPAHEVFCQGIAVGMGHSEAAVEAGFTKKSARTQAARLLHQEAIRDRISVLTAKKQVATAYTLADAVREAEEARQFAITMRSAGALATATKLKAELSGLLVQRTENQTTVKTAQDGARDLSKAVSDALSDPVVQALLQSAPATLPET